MTINSEFAKIFDDSGLKDDELAVKLGVAKADIGKLRQNQLYPSHSLVEEISKVTGEQITRPYQIDHDLKNGLRVGNKVSPGRMALSILFIIFVSALLTGFGHQPLWLFLIVLFIGLFFTLPGCFQSYWIIHDTRMEHYSFSKYDAMKLAQLLGLTKKFHHVIEYDEVQTAQLIYHQKGRTSPFDVQPDDFRIKFVLKDGRKRSIPIDHNLELDLKNFVDLLNRFDINVYDEQNILTTMQKGENIFEHFNILYN